MHDYVLLAKEKVSAFRLVLKSLDRQGARDTYEQILAEGQIVAESALHAEARLGEVLEELPKHGPGSHDGTRSLPDGIDKRASHYAQQLAAHPEVIAKVVASAKEAKELPTRRDVLAAIKSGNVHVGQNTGNDEWFTPPEYIAAAKAVMGAIDLDPASCAAANKFVGAERFFSAEDNGLAHEWFGRVWMNPPYSRGIEYKFCDKLIAELCADRVTEAIVLVNNATETAWFHKLSEAAASVCFPRGRIRFLMASGKPHGGSPLQGQAVLYFGAETDSFTQEFRRSGHCWAPERI